jgi:hypothetical protein
MRPGAVGCARATVAGAGARDVPVSSALARATSALAICCARAAAIARSCARNVIYFAIVIDTCTRALEMSRVWVASACVCTRATGACAAAANCPRAACGFCYK